MYKRGIWLVGAFVSYALLLIVVPALAGLTDDYNHNQDIEFVNDGISNINQPLLFTFNSADMIDYGYIQPDAEDVTIDYLGQEEYVTACNLSGTNSQWRTERVSIPPGNNLIKTFWFGNASGTRNQPLIASGSDTYTIINPGSFAFNNTESFTIRCKVTPADNPGTRQYIFGYSGSYELTMEPGPLWRWYCVGSGVPSSTSTLSASIGTMSDLIAWHNGVGNEIVLCDTETNMCNSTSFTDLALGGTLHACTFDGIIDHLSINTPDFVPLSGTPPGGPGTPPGESFRPLGVYGLETTKFTLPYTLDLPTEDHCGAGPYPTYDEVALDISEPMIDGVHNTQRYGLRPYGTADGLTRISNISFACPGSTTAHWNDNHPVEGVSMSATIYMSCSIAQKLRFIIYDPILNGATAKTDNVVHNTGVGVYTYNSGTLTHNPIDSSWVVGDIEKCTYGLQLRDDDSANPYCSVDNNSCNVPDVAYVYDFVVKYKVAQ